MTLEKALAVQSEKKISHAELYALALGENNVQALMALEKCAPRLMRQSVSADRINKRKAYYLAAMATVSAPRALGATPDETGYLSALRGSAQRRANTVEKFMAEVIA